MRIRQQPVKRARIEIINMIDVIFFLLVFFMVTSLAMTRINSLPVALPKTSSKPQAIEQNAVLTVRRDGSLFVNKQAASLDNLGTLLAFAMRKDPQGVVVVNADAGANYGLVVRVMDKARAIGVRRFALATEAGK